MKRRPFTSRYAVLNDIHQPLDVLCFEDVVALQSGHYRGVGHRLDIDTQQLAHRMCPVQLWSGECLIVVLAEYVHDDDVVALFIAMQQASLKLARPALVAVNASQFSAVARVNWSDGRDPAQRLHTVSTPGHVLFCVLDDMLSWALQHGASDLHLGVFDHEANANIAFSVRGSLVRPEQFAHVSKEVMLELLAVVWMNIQGGSGAVFESQREQQGRFERVVNDQCVRLRWASVASHQGPSVTLRLLNRGSALANADMTQLGYSEHELECLYRARLAVGGAVLFSGAVGSGKSTTLGALIRGLPSDRKVMTLEDPVELELPNAIQCAITTFGDEQHALSRFDLKLQAIKRSAANDVLIGEIRDAGSARALSDLLIAGVNVYSTLHAGSAIQIVHRLCSPFLGLSPDLLGVPGALKLLVYQVLLNRLCDQCAYSAQEWLDLPEQRCALGLQMTRHQAAQWLRDLNQNLSGADQFVRFRSVHGCSNCAGTDQPYKAGCGGSLMAAEMIEPRRVAGFSQWIQSLTSSDGGNHQTRLQSMLSDASFVSARQRAHGYVLKGWLDPREFELRFGW